MDFHHTKDAAHGLFIAQQDGQKAGEVSYFESGDNIIVLDHTAVEDAFQGQQLGKRLVDQVVDYARANGLKIVPQCTYAHRLFEKSDHYADVWQQEEPKAP